MVIAVTRIHGIAGRRDDLRDLMRRTEQRVAEEPGCRLYRFTVTLDDPDEYLHSPPTAWTVTGSPRRPPARG
jgi:quinol monooxygenase YgiN